MTENEKKLLVELICNEQTHMIIKDHTRYDTDKYKELEALKIKIKDMWGGYYECLCLAVSTKAREKIEKELFNKRFGKGDNEWLELSKRMVL